MKFVIYKEIDSAELVEMTPLLRQGFELSTELPNSTARKAAGSVRRGSTSRKGPVQVVRVTPDRPVKVTRRVRRHTQCRWSDEMILAALKLRETGLKWRIIARRLRVKCTGGAVSQVCHKRMPEQTAKVNQLAMAARAGE
jgi:hypothetical protein